MKKIILVILTSISIFANDTNNTIILKKKIKETNTTKISKEVLINKTIFDKLYSIIPSYLQPQKKSNFLNFSIGYDTKTKKISINFHLKIVLPSLEIKYQKTKEKNLLKKIKTKTFKIKITPIIVFKKLLPIPVIKTSFTFQNDEIIKNFTFNETIKYYTIYPKIQETTTFTFNRFLKNNLTFSASKYYTSTDKGNIFYNFGLYYYSDFFKFIRIYGYEIGGKTKESPFIYWQKLFFTYRKTLFNKRYIFIDFTPYLYYSKEYTYHPKIFFTTSLNVKF